MTRISIAFATFNGEKYITDQLESLVAQTLRPAELVVCDDGSQDRTLELVEAFARRAPFPVRINRNEQRLGYRANFMKAAGLCTGDLIAFCDQDDVWDKRKLELVAAQFDSSDVLLVYHNAWIASADLKPTQLALQPHVVKRLRCGSLPSPWFYPCGHSVVFRRHLLPISDLWAESIDPNGPSAVMAHDQWFFWLATTLGDTKFVDEPLVSYRQHGRNTYGLPLIVSRLDYFRPSFLRSRLAASADIYRNHQEAAANRISLLNSLYSRTEEKSPKQLGVAIENYRELAERLAMRAQLYRSASLRDRLNLILEIARRGGYRNNWIWSFGRAGLAKDLLLGLPFAMATPPEAGRFQ
jgi:glycosyltransferase involved in cell wall biosynthesis